MHLQQWPTAPQFEGWKQSLIDELLAVHPKDQDELFAWILEVEERGKKMEDLADSGKFVTLDMKLSAALSKVAKGNTARKIATLNKRLRRAKKFLRGRQKLWIVYGAFACDEERGGYHDIEDLLALAYPGDDKIA